MIKYKCHGNKDSTTPAMVNTLKGMPANAPDQFKHETIEVREWDPCLHGRDICIGGYITKKQDLTWVPQTMTISVSDAEGDDQGQLEYEIDCSKSPQCDVCDKMNHATGFASFVAGVFAPALSLPADVIAAGVSLHCANEGCF